MARKSHQRGSVELHNGRWTLRYRERDHSTGRWEWKREELPLCRHKKEALKAAEPVMARVNERNNDPHQPPRKTEALTFRAFVEGLWRSYQENEELQPSSVVVYDCMTRKYLLPAFGDKPLGEITPQDLTRFFGRVRGKVSSSYLLRIYALASSMFEVALQHDLIAAKPIRSKLHRPKPEKKEKPTLPPAISRAIIERVPQRYKVLFALLAVTGMRIGECLALRWLNLDSAARTLSITHSLWRGRIKRPKTPSSRRALRLPAALVGLLERHREQSRFTTEGDFIFCNDAGEPLNANLVRRDVLYPAMDALGIERGKRTHGFHIFRHSAGSVIHALTRDLKLIQHTLGHSQLSTTADIYVHVDPDRTAEATAALASEIIEDGANGDLPVTQGSDLIN